MLTRRGFGLTTAAAGLASTVPAWAQMPLTSEQRLHLEGRYLPYYLELKSKVEAGDADARGALSQYAAFLGDERTAVGLYERSPRAGDERPTLEGAESRDAIEAVVEAARGTQVVILNEAHNVSAHRAFAARVVRALRPLGFDWFAAEAFTPPQDGPAPSVSLYRDGMAFTRDFGWYTQDPVFAETIREAARLGYRFRDYEFNWMQRAPDDAGAEARIAMREQAQADNLIANVLAPNPNAKVLVYVGYDHAMEKPNRFGTWFAARLKAASGIDPLTIEQAYNWLALDPANDAPHVAAVLDRFEPQDSIVVSKGGVAFASQHFTGQSDLSVFHPRRPEVAGRPGWLAADPLRRAVEVAVPRFDGLALLQALRVSEGPAGVPADQFLLKPGQSTASFMLYPGSYFLRLEHRDGIDPAYGTIDVEA